MMRRAKVALLGAMGIASCAAPRSPAPPHPASETHARIDPLLGIVSGAGLEWLLQAKPGELFADDAIGRAVDAIAPPARMAQFEARYGGMHLRQAREVIVAGYPGTILAAARLPIDQARVEAAFAARAIAVGGRVANPGVTRLWGEVDGEREQMALFGSEAVAVEHGQLDPLRPAVYFAEGKLRRVRPAIRTEPLAAVAARLGDAPLLGFVPGPFNGGGLGGLLRATTAAAGAAWLADAPQGTALRVRVVLGGSWGDDAVAAGARLTAAFRGVADDSLGHLLGIDRPIQGPRVATDPAALELDVTLDAMALARGLRAATGASLHEILGLSAAH